MGEERGGAFCVYFKDFEGGEWMREKVSDFFHSSQNEEICGNLCRMIVFYQNTLSMHFITISK